VARPSRNQKMVERGSVEPTKCSCPKSVGSTESRPTKRKKSSPFATILADTNRLQICATPDTYRAGRDTVERVCSSTRIAWFRLRNSPGMFWFGALVPVLALFCLVCRGFAAERDEGKKPENAILGLTGKVTDVQVAVPAREVIIPGQ